VTHGSAQGPTRRALFCSCSCLRASSLACREGKVASMVSCMPRPTLVNCMLYVEGGGGWGAGSRPGTCLLLPGNRLLLPGQRLVLLLQLRHQLLLRLLLRRHLLVLL
jgi:hypothetical protein